MVDSKSHFTTYFKELLNADNLFRWELQILEENRHEEYLHRAHGFFNFVSELLEIYTNYEQKNFSNTLNIITDLEKKLVDIFQDTPQLCISRALNHVVHISKAAIFLYCGKSEDSFEVLGKMISYRDLNPTEEAAVLGVRSACCAMYSYKGLRDALDYIDRAIRKDAETPFWRFLKAMYLYRSRTVLNPMDPPSLEELELLKKVNEEQSDPLFMVYLADVLRESADANKNRKELNFWFIPLELKKSLKEETENNYKESKALYENAYMSRPNCPVIASRCANGLMRIQQAYQNIKLAKEIITNLIQEDENNAYVNMVAVLYYSNFGQKPDVAKGHLHRAMNLNVFNAHINSIRMSFIEEKGKFDISKLEKLLDTFVEAPKRKIVFAQIISYYLFIKVDVEAACNNVIKYLDTGGPRNSLENHKSLFRETGEPISLVEIIADEIKFNMANRNLSPKLREYFEKFIHKMHFYNLNCAWSGKPQNLKKQILGGKIPDTKTRCPQKPSNQNQKFGKNNMPNQKCGANNAQNQKPNLVKKQQNLPKPNVTSGPSSRLPNQIMASGSTSGPSSRLPNQIMASGSSNKLPNGVMAQRQEIKSVPESKPVNDGQEVETKTDQKKVNRPEHDERKDRHRRHSSVSSSSSDDRHGRSRKQHRRKKYSTSSSESEYRSRRHRSPSRSRRHRYRSKEHKKSHRDHKKHRRHRYSSPSSDSSSSYDRYRKKGHRHSRHYSSSDVSSSERYKKKHSSRYAKEGSIKKADDDPKNLTKRMNDMSLGHNEDSSRRLTRKKQ